MFVRRFTFCNQNFRRISSLSLNVKDVLTHKPISKSLVIQGWIQSVRKHKNIYFVDVIDGSCINRLQVVIEADGKSSPTYGSSIRVEGELVKSNHKGQEVELLCKTWKTLGLCSEDYPFCNRLQYSSEYIRQFVHLRPKTKTFGSILRIRSCASQVIHTFFQNKGFHLVHPPVITGNDCEGAGEVFSVQLNKAVKENIESNAHIVSEHSSHKNGKTKNSFFEQDSDDEGVNETAAAEEDNEEFFGKPVYLSVSGQLHLEAAASALSRVYCFGPTFRAESSRSRLHASEFHMLEAEVAFVDSLDCLTQIAQSCIKTVAEALLNSSQSEINWINEKHTNIYQKYIERVVSESFVEMPYSEAVNILQRDQSSFTHQATLGKDFSSEHKQHLLRHCDNVPVIVSMFPAQIKPFYMKEDSKGMAHCFDIFAPFGGEICGGSLREDSAQKLEKKLDTLGIKDTLSWYLDLRKYGGVPHGGFGIGFDRLIQSILGIPNIRDVIPFPRRRNDCQC